MNDEFFTKLCNALKKNSIINFIDFSETELPNNAADKLLDLLESNKKIRDINLNYSKNISEEDKIKVEEKILEYVSKIKKLFIFFIDYS